MWKMSTESIIDMQAQTKSAALICGEKSVEFHAMDITELREVFC